jgi:hypothetical protein
MNTDYREAPLLQFAGQSDRQNATLVDNTFSIRRVREQKGGNLIRIRRNFTACDNGTARLNTTDRNGFDGYIEPYII